MFRLGFGLALPCRNPRKWQRLALLRWALAAEARAAALERQLAAERAAARERDGERRPASAASAAAAGPAAAVAGDGSTDGGLR